MNKIASKIEKSINILKSIQLQLLADEEIIDSTIYNITYLFHSLFLNFLLFNTSIQKSEGKLNPEQRKFFLNFYKKFLQLKTLDMSLYISRILELAQIIEAIKSDKDLMEFYSSFVIFYSLDGSGEAEILLEKNNLHPLKNSLFFSLIASIILSKPTIDEFTLSSLLEIKPISIPDDLWFGDEETLKKYKKDKESLEERDKEDTNENLVDYVKKSLEIQREDNKVLDFVAKYTAHKKSINIDKDSLISYIDIVLEGFFELYGDILKGHSIHLINDKNSIMIPIFSDIKFSGIILYLSDLHRSIYEFIMRFPNIRSSIVDIRKMIENNIDPNSEDGQMINLLKDLYISVDKIAFGLLQDIDQYELYMENRDKELLKKFSVWSYIVGEEMFKDYKVYNNFNGKGLIEEILAFLLQLMSKLKAANLSAGVFFDKIKF